MSKFTVPALILAAGSAFAQQQPNTLTECEKKEGFTLLYDGTLASFKNTFVNYVKNDANTTALSSEWAVNPATGAIGIQVRTEDVRSRRMYRDFDLRLSYRCDGNEGIFYRHKLTGDRAWMTGIEFAINNYTNQNKDAPGAAYDLIPPNPNAYHLHATGKWNEVRIAVKGDSAEHWMNGQKVVGFKFHNESFWAYYAVSKWNASQMMSYNVPNNKAAGYIQEGYIGLQGDHGGKWEIRNLRISETPYHGPAHDDATCATGVLDGAPRAAFPGAALRRAGSGVRLDLPGTDVISVSLVSMEGRTFGGVPGAGGAAFSGALRPGLYAARIRTAAGDFTRRLSLL